MRAQPVFRVLNCCRPVIVLCGLFPLTASLFGYHQRVCSTMCFLRRALCRWASVRARACVRARVFRYSR